MKVVAIRVGLTQALGSGAFGGDVAEGAAGLKGGAGIVDEDFTQRVGAAAQRGLEFFGRAKRIQLAQMHDSDAIAMALRLLQEMGSEEQSGAVVGPQIDQMFPDRIARNWV